MNVKNALLLIVALLSYLSVNAQTTIPGGNVSGTWDAAGSPYLIEGEIIVPHSESLNIDPSVVIVFRGHYKLIVHGLLFAEGTENDSILFTAADTSSGWHSIRFIDAPDSSRLSYCIIQYGNAEGSWTSDDKHGGGIYCMNSNPVISNCTIQYNRAQYSPEGFGGGIYCDNSSPSIDNCNICENFSTKGGGLYFINNSDATVTRCMIAENTIPHY